MAVLRVEGLRKQFGAKRALDGVSLALEAGEVLALLGPTGAGKTTTLRIVSGLEMPDAGRVLIDGQDVTSLSPRMRDVAVVFEGFNLLPMLSVFDNIAFPLRSPVYGRPEPEVRLAVEQAAETLRIARLLDRRVEQLSGGERQRVAIARAMVRRPRLYLLDEPLSALDLKLRERLETEIREMYGATGATVVYATHDYPSAAGIATRIALIESGRVLQEAPLVDLIADPHHAAVGRLIGSPSMVFFTGRASGGRLEIDGLPLVLPAPGADGRVLIGIWPEEVEMLAAATPGAAEGRIWATDFRGRDRAIEVRAGPHRFRKVVALSAPFGQGDACWFRLPANVFYLFDPDTGDRIR
jgi:multiple sugar transport system ATP-binding protein